MCMGPNKYALPAAVHTAIIGGGAAGLFCAGSFPAAKLVLEQNTVPAAKVRVSGGGKCNFSNRFAAAADYLSQSPHFCKNALAAFGPEDFLRLLAQNRIPFEERAQGRLFALDAQEIGRFLVRRAAQNNTLIRTGVRVQSVAAQDGGFLVQTSQGPVRAQRVVLAAGGLSFPDLGGGNTSFKLARALGLPVTPLRPALCGLAFPKALRERFCALAGNSLTACVQTGCKKFTGDLLFTHEGISGPSVLNASLYWCEGQAVHINFLPACDAGALFQAQKNTARTLSAALKDRLPAKIAKTILAPLPDNLSDAKKATLVQAARLLNDFCFIPERSAGYTKAEVTAGGVDCTAVHAHTMECKHVRGLYIIGEALDVTGRLGGFNLQWAWSSAMAAARSLAVSF